jgi:hypothetical protein
MKTTFAYIFILISPFILTYCGGKGSVKKVSEADTISVPDTGFTGIKKYMDGSRVAKEVTFKNGVREGQTKTFDVAGRLYQTFWYENDLREDSACWYYQEGQVFRITPFKKDTIEGIQKQYYRTGELRAKIGFSKGLRTPFFQEFEKDGKVFHGYPYIVVNIKDEYSSKGLYQIGLSLSDKSTRVKFYRGGYTNGRMDTTLCKLLKTTDGKATLVLKKTNEPHSNSTDIVAFILTPLANRYIATKKIELPYNDLN